MVACGGITVGVNVSLSTPLVICVVICSGPLT